MDRKKNCNEESDKGYFVEVDTQYLEKLPEFHNDLSFLDKTSNGAIKNKNISKNKLGEVLHKSIIRTFKKRTHTFYRKYLGCLSCWYANNKQIRSRNLFFIMSD